MRSSTAPYSAIRNRRRPPAFSLAEIIVALGLVSLLMLSIYSVLNSGTRYLRQSTLVTELQQSCVIAATRLVGELLESNRNSIRSDDLHLSVTFGSARDPRAGMTFDTAAGGAQLLWFSRVGYYIQEEKGEPCLFRKEEPIEPPATSAPLIASSYGAAYWIAAPNLRRMIASRVYYIDVVSSTNVDVIIGVKSEDSLFQVIMKTKLKTRN